jgi:translation elongation factor EF-1alpha
MKDLEDAINSLEAWEAKESGASEVGKAPEKELVGTVEQFFERINVVAIKLNGTLKVGDVIEIGDDEEAVRQRISSMQINRENVEEAGEGDSVGIKLNYRVAEGREVYKMASQHR